MRSRLRCAFRALQTPILRDAPRLRKSRTPATVISIRRSTRLAAKPRAPNATLQAQAVLMQKLGLPVDTPPADLEALERYVDTFIEAGSPPDPVAMNLPQHG